MTYESAVAQKPDIRSFHPSPVKKNQWKGKEIVVLVAGFGAAGAFGGFVIAGPLGAIVGAVMGIAIGVLYAGYALYHSNKELVADIPVDVSNGGLLEAQRGLEIPQQIFTVDFEQPVAVNFRETSEERSISIIAIFWPPQRTEQEAKRQLGLDLGIELDSARMSGDLTFEDFTRILDKELELTVRQNILFANCQDFDIALQQWFNRSLLRRDLYRVTQNGRVCEGVFSTLKNDEKKEVRTTTLTSELKVRLSDTSQMHSHDDGVIERFKVTAVLHWDTGEVTITKSPISS